MTPQAPGPFVGQDLWEYSLKGKIKVGNGPKRGGNNIVKNFLRKTRTETHPLKGPLRAFQVLSVPSVNEVIIPRCPYRVHSERGGYFGNRYWQ